MKLALRVLRRPAQDPPRGGGLHTERARDDRGPVGHAVSALERDSDGGLRSRPSVRCPRRSIHLVRPVMRSSRPRGHLPTTRRGMSRATRRCPWLSRLFSVDADVQTLRHWLSDPTARLISLTGPGGVGKTRLALELARAQAVEGTSRVCSSGWPRFGTRHSWQPPSPRRSACWTPRPWTCRDARRLRATGRRRCSCSIFRAGPGRGGAGRRSPDRSRAAASARHQPRARCVRGRAEYAVGPLALDVNVEPASPVDLARSPRCGSSWSGLRTCNPTFASRPPTASP